MANRVQYKIVPFTWEERHLIRGRWVKYISEDTRFEAWVDSVQSDGVTVAGVFYTYEEFAKVYKFSDNSPCGKHIVEE